jgi:hypothetical protein
MVPDGMDVVEEPWNIRQYLDQETSIEALSNHPER